MELSPDSAPEAVASPTPVAVELPEATVELPEDTDEARGLVTAPLAFQ